MKHAHDLLGAEGGDKIDVLQQVQEEIADEARNPVDAQSEVSWMPMLGSYH